MSKQLFTRTPRGFITSEEGRRSLCYRDNAKGAYPTIGIGHKDVKLIPGVTRWTDTQIDATFDTDYTRAVAGISAAFPAFARLDTVRQAVLVSMAFQMGVAGTLLFKRALAAIAAKRWDDAAHELLASDWQAQTPERCDRAAEMMRSGEWPEVFNGEKE